MGLAMSQSFSGDPQILLDRLGAFLRRQGSAKQLSLKLNTDVRTIENFRAGRSWPIARHYLSIWLEFGDDFIEALHHPERVEARLLKEAEAREEAKRRRIASTMVASFHRGLAAGLAEGAGQDEEPLGPPNLDLFEERP